MKTISLLVDIIATGIECYMCYLFCSTFVDSKFFNENGVCKT